MGTLFRQWLILASIFAAMPVIAQTTTKCDEWMGSITCRSTGQLPQQKSEFERTNDTLLQIIRNNNERKRAEEQKQLQLKQIEIQERTRRQIEQQSRYLQEVQQQQEAQQLASDQLNKEVSQAILDGRCNDAKNIALTA